MVCPNPDSILLPTAKGRVATSWDEKMEMREGNARHYLAGVIAAAVRPANVSRVPTYIIDPDSPSPLNQNRLKEEVFFRTSPIDTAETASSTTRGTQFEEDAWKQRELCSALLDSEWLGLRLLLQLRNGNAKSANELAESLGGISELLTCVARLMKFGALDIDNDYRFGSTEYGEAVLARIEEKSGVAFTD